MIQWEKVTKEDSLLVHRIVKRAREIVPSVNPMDLEMDLIATHISGCELDLYLLATADDFNFSHDVFGIHSNIDRETGKLQNCFLPRYTK